MNRFFIRNDFYLDRFTLDYWVSMRRLLNYHSIMIIISLTTHALTHWTHLFEWKREKATEERELCFLIFKHCCVLIRMSIRRTKCKYTLSSMESSPCSTIYMHLSIWPAIISFARELHLLMSFRRISCETWRKKNWKKNIQTSIYRENIVL